MSQAECNTVVVLPTLRFSQLQPRREQSVIPFPVQLHARLSDLRCWHFQCEPCYNVHKRCVGPLPCERCVRVGCTERCVEHKRRSYTRRVTARKNTRGAVIGGERTVPQALHVSFRQRFRPRDVDGRRVRIPGNNKQSPTHGRSQPPSRLGHRGCGSSHHS